MSRVCMLIVAVCAAALLCPAAALAQYPPPGDPGKKVERPRGKPATLRVCKQKKSDCFRTIGAAVKKARSGDRILVSNGTYREGVQIVGRAKSRIKLLGNRKRPGRVLLQGKGLSGPRAQNGVIINGANGVTVAGFKAKNYKGNGFFAVNVTGYVLTDLIAERTGAYGVYAFNSKGGKMTDSEAYFNNDSGFYVGQTPPQARPKRTIVRNVDSWGNVIGFSGTNMRYTTITKSRWFNNGLGIVPNSLDSEKFAPPSDNVIIDNDIFWNNFNYYAGAPFELREESGGLPAYPVGTGVLLFGGQRHRIQGNRFYGNWLTGFGAIQQVLQSEPTQQDPNNQRGVLRDNEVVGNDFGLGGADLNGRDMFYDGSGSGNCFADNTLRSVNLPASNSTFATCPFTGANAFDSAAQGEALGWVAAPTGQFWRQSAHKAKKGIKPFTLCTENARCKKALVPPSAGAARTKLVKVRDYFFTPERLRVKQGGKVTWRWPSTAGEPHDVKATKVPRGAKKFQSDLAASDYSYRRTFRKRGRYTIICSLHPDNMRQAIRVVR